MKHIIAKNDTLFEKLTHLFTRKAVILHSKYQTKM